MKILLIILLLTNRVQAASQSDAAARGYTSAVSVQGLLEFSGSLIMIQSTLPSWAEVQDHIRYQNWHLLGGMKVGSTIGGPLSDQKISNVLIRQDLANNQLFHITYDYVGTAIFKKGVGKEVVFPLPIDPIRFYQKSLVQSENRCVNYPTYGSERYFFYFWDPFRSGCPLQENIDFTKVTARFTAYKNTATSYPEYDRLADQNGEIFVSLLFGLEAIDKKHSAEKALQTDYNGANYRGTREALIRSGFTGARWTAEQIAAAIPAPLEFDPYIEEFTKNYASGKKVRVRMFFGQSDLDGDSKAFHYMLKDSIENAAVMLYVGHSGLGGTFGLWEVERKRGFTFFPNRNRYQIFAFHSCSSYAYYTNYFFDLKANPSDPYGSKNLDIIANGIVGSFDAGLKTTTVMMQAIDGWASGKGRRSYQQLGAAMEDHALLGISGDADNPTY